MTTKSKLLVLTILLLALGEVLGHSVAIWCKGGEGGTVNLPAAKSRLMSPGGAKLTAYRVGFRMDDAGRGLELKLPTNLQLALATFTYGNLVVASPVVSRKVYISGNELVKLQKAGVDSFRIHLDDGFDTYLKLVVVLLKDGRATCEVLVE